VTERSLFSPAAYLTRRKKPGFIRAKNPIVERDRKINKGRTDDQVEREGPAADTSFTQIIGVIQSGMSCLVSANLGQLRERARYIRVAPPPCAAPSRMVWSK
jgi:hypothetical protein